MSSALRFTTANLGNRSSDPHDAREARTGQSRAARTPARAKGIKAGFVGLTLKRITRALECQSCDEVCMQQVTQRGRRFFAVPKVMTLTDRVAARTNLRGNWQKVMTHNRTAHVILNYHKR